MKSRLALALFLFATASLVADPNPKAALAADIMRAYGVEELVESTRVEMTKQAQGALQNALGQVKSALPQMSEEAWARIMASADKYTKSAMSGWDSAGLTRIYAKVYEDNYSEAELKALLDYLKTDAGAKSVRVEKIAAQAINEAIMSETTKSLQAALQTFMTEIQAIVGEEVQRLQAEAAK
jgi:hypothetical protein